MLVYSAAITRYQSPSRHQHVQHITIRQSIDQLKNSRVAILLHEAQAIHCNHFRMKSSYSPFHFPVILWLKMWHVHDRFQQTLQPSRITHISRSENSKLNLVSLQDAGGLRCYDSEVRVFILLFVLP